MFRVNLTKKEYPVYVWDDHSLSFLTKYMVIPRRIEGVYNRCNKFLKNQMHASLYLKQGSGYSAIELRVVQGQCAMVKINYDSYYGDFINAFVLVSDYFWKEIKLETAYKIIQNIRKECTEWYGIPDWMGERVGQIKEFTR